jgi:cytochrome c oxidase subunit 2
VSRIFWCLFFTAWPILGIVVSVISPQMNWGFPDNRESATPLGERIDDLFYLILCIVTIAFIGTMVVLAYVLWKASKNEDEKGWFSHGSHNLEVIWTIVPAGILLFIALYQMDVWAIYRVRDYDLKQQNSPRLNNLVAEVIARQFEWRIRYPAPGTVFKSKKQIDDWLAKPQAGDLYTVNHLHVPLNKETLIYLKSGDVQHSFFVPEMRVKQDAIPGQNIDIWFTVNRAGDFDLTCAELCGWGHYKMRGRVTAIEDFSGFLQKLKAEQDFDGISKSAGEIAATGQTQEVTR